MSARASTACGDVHCSGAMYAGEPSVTPCPVSSSASSTPGEVSVPSAAFAIPKSSSFGRSCPARSITITFEPLMSR